MRFLPWLFLIFLLGPGVASEEPDGQLQIRLLEEGWGNASLEDARRVLKSAGNVLWRAAGKPSLPVIEVSPSGGPIVFFRRGPEGEIRVRLSTRDRFWCQYAYQFAHEMGHILCSFDSDTGPNDWFEESLCELASFFTLRQMAREWREDPPWQNWREYSSALDDYCQRLLEKGQLPLGMDLATWFSNEEQHLRRTPADRQRNRIVAVALLPLFEESPEIWRAVATLNGGDSSQGESFSLHLGQWLARSEKRHHRLIRKLARQFGVSPAWPDPVSSSLRRAESVGN